MVDQLKFDISLELQLINIYIIKRRFEKLWELQNIIINVWKLSLWNRYKPNSYGYLNHVLSIDQSYRKYDL